MYDLVTFGEAVLRLSTPNFLRIEQAASLNVGVGGSELNIAVGGSRLGLSTAWVSRLPANALGRMIQNKAREHGVDTSHIVWCKDDRVGIYYLEYGASPRASNLIYDRKDSALSCIQKGEVPWERVLRDSRVYMVSGITPALSAMAREVTVESVAAAKKVGAKVCMDANYRSKLWSQEEAQNCLVPLMKSVDVLLTTEEDCHKALGIRGSDYKEVARILGEKFGIEVVVITLREDLSVWRNNWTAVAFSKGKYHETRKYELEIVDRVGGGDSLTAAFLYGYLQGDVQRGLDLGVAFSALKHSHNGDFAWCTLEEAENLFKGGSLRINR
jgi:2-dehydro-3-deoxygluconokinase